VRGNPEALLALLEPEALLAFPSNQPSKVDHVEDAAWAMPRLKRLQFDPNGSKARLKAKNVKSKFGLLRRARRKQPSNQISELSFLLRPAPRPGRPLTATPSHVS